MFLYRFCGLGLHADLLFPYAQPDETAPADIVVHAGDVPETLPDATHEGLLYQLNATSVIYHLPDIARFQVNNGREIVYQAAGATDMDTIRVFLTSIMFPLLFHQRRDMAVRGCAVEVNGAAVLLTGYSGVGKSTLAAAMMQRGYRILSDEFSIIRFDDATKQALVYPTFSYLHVWHFALYKLNYSLSAIEQMPRVRPQIEKRILDVGDCFQSQPLPLRGIYIMNAPMKELEPLMLLTPQESLLQVNWMLSYERLAIEMGVIQDYWQKASALISTVRFWHLHRVKRTFDLDTLIRLVTESAST